MRRRDAVRRDAASSKPRLLAIVLVSALAVVLIPYLGIALLFVWGGSDSVTYRALSPDGALEARVERQGGSMQFPVSSLIVGPRGGLFTNSGEDCVAVRWSGKDRDDPKQRDAARNPTVIVRWQDARTLVATDPDHVLALPVRACGVTIEPCRGDAS